MCSTVRRGQRGNYGVVGCNEDRQSFHRASKLHGWRGPQQTTSVSSPSHRAIRRGSALCLCRTVPRTWSGNLHATCAAVVERHNKRRTPDNDPFFRTEEKSQFSPDVTPLILAAQYNNHEIVQMFLSRSHTIDRPQSTSPRPATSWRSVQVGRPSTDLTRSRALALIASRSRTTIR